VFRHVGLVSFFGFGFFLLRANPETGPFFYIVNSLHKGGEYRLQSHFGRSLNAVQQLHGLRSKRTDASAG
jgi:hypothetical protein